MTIEDSIEAGAGTETVVPSIFRTNGGRAVKLRGADGPRPDPFQAADDPVEMYMREIEGICVLRRREERVLAREIEAASHVESVETNLAALEGRSVKGWEIVVRLLRDSCSSVALTEAITGYVGLSGELTISELVEHRAVRETLDGDFRDDLLDHVASVTGMTPVDVDAEMRALSLSSRLIPRKAIEVVGRDSPLSAALEQTNERDFDRRLDGYKLAFYGYLGGIRYRGASARERLVRANLRLVVKVARRYTGKGTLALDLIREGNIGLLRAAENYDCRRGDRFRTFARQWIRHAVVRAVTTQTQ